MFNSPFPRRLILLKKLLYHIGKHKLDIHGRILSIIAVFFLQTLIMLSELLDIFPADVFRDQLQKSGILHLLYFHIEMLLIIGINMLFRMIKLFFHLLLQLTHDLRQTFISVKLSADRQIKAFFIGSFQKRINMVCHKAVITVMILKQKQGLPVVQVQIKEHPSQLLLELRGKIFLSCIKK